MNIFVGHTPLDNVVTLPMDTPHRLAGSGVTEPLKAPLTRWEENLPNPLTYR
ncbi:hypothetical protein Halru_2411 [Halovivax ruber XH-70]|uniref:Uncharacterized protein n=1 Tax=Halovivax ruber (strain DSM 18193 / JCM 13892 / XH-70) TaxID=797302 RepID=L0IE07_HALRX|nr:hypothetical protein Halru_2411 [Halovivax ruber XH-70]